VWLFGRFGRPSLLRRRQPVLTSKRRPLVLQLRTGTAVKRRNLAAADPVSTVTFTSSGAVIPAKPGRNRAFASKGDWVSAATAPSGLSEGNDATVGTVASVGPAVGCCGTSSASTRLLNMPCMRGASATQETWAIVIGRSSLTSLDTNGPCSYVLLFAYVNSHHVCLHGSHAVTAVSAAPREGVVGPH
jgi:hypothetical protein